MEVIVLPVPLLYRPVAPFVAFIFVLSVGLGPASIVAVPVLYIPEDFFPSTSRFPENSNFPLLEIPTFSASPILPLGSVSPTPDNLIEPVFLPWLNLSVYIPILCLPCKSIIPSFTILSIVDATVPVEVAAIPTVLVYPFPTVIVL